MADVSVAELPAEERGVFHDVARSVYAGQPQGTQPNDRAVDLDLDREQFRGAGQQQLFVAYAGGDPVGRAAARLSPRLADREGRPFGMVSHFECRDDPAAARALLETVVKWLRARGARRVVGPMNGDTWHRYRVNIGPFTRPPFPLEPWNPPNYARLWEGAGWRPVESYSSKWIDDVTQLLPGLANGERRARDHGVRIRSLDRDRLADELGIVHAVSTKIFADAFLYSPISLQEFLALYAGVERLLDPDLVLFAEAPAAGAVGFVFAYADPAEAAVHYKTIGVLAEWRRAGVAAALSHHVYSRALAKGLPAGNHALMRDDNRSQALDQGMGTVFRRYLLYEWPDGS